MTWGDLLLESQTNDKIYLLQIVRIHFQALDMECGCDHVRVYDSHYEQNRHLAELCQLPVDPIFNATSNVMIISMISDGTYSKDGFNLTWDTIGKI